MRNKALALFVGALFVAGHALAAIPNPSFVNSDGEQEPYQVKKGPGGRQSAPARVVVLVRWARAESDTAALASGDPVVWSGVSDDAVTIDTTTTSADAAFAGILVTPINTADQGNVTSAADDEGKGNWGYMIVYGPAQANVGNGHNAATAGEPFFTSTDAGDITAWSSDSYAVHGNSQTIEDAATAKAGGIFLDAVTTGDTAVEVFVQNE